MLARLVKENPEDVRVVYRNFPLMSIHDKAAIAMQAAEAAGAQGKFWEMHDLLFDKQSDWSTMSVDDFKTWATDQAVGLGLDKAKFSEDMNSDAAAAKAKAAWDYGVAINLRGTPFLLFNGSPYQGPVNYSTLSAIVQMILLEKRQFTTCPPMTVDQSKQYFATLKTEKGDIVLQLYADKAPLAVNSFVFLANQGWFNGITFHRVIPGYVAQTGDPSGSGYGGPGYAFDNEISPDLKFDAPGVVGMANAGAGTNGSQFFITMAPEPKLDGSYTIFGRVVSGMDVVNNLTPRDPSQGDNLPPGDKLISVTIEEK